ncbi:hypothetical protein JCGZ_26350 [Jatropha curcas]|uniref:JHL07K02.3 protein n=1 Tax=Jatropha curcas TaxID=180498 RepID=E6NU03_JATCU|nr:uncharacterized protein JHL07K02.3 [Jatropha curcas]XP_012090557.1 uncharacterized protein JHL07K02.3 [Jatropha curcas]KDP22519.1 hypothetical protein JCGZ_26350 [Jatropha curcas]BAJ53113.1 JHL07K02.3 [Jatropha curcas]
MAHRLTESLLLLSILILACDTLYSQALLEEGSKVKSATFRSPMFVLGPGSVENRYYFNINFPRGHIAIKSFDAEVVDAAGNPVPLHETYLHHWVVAKYYKRLDVENTDKDKYISGNNSGICQGRVLRQYFGLGSETRRTDTYVPDPYGIEIGNPAEIPVGYEERWLLNVHAIDTRGVEDRLGCTECRCDLYNVTVDEYERPLRSDYNGGLLCCYDRTQCRVTAGFEGARRKLYLRYKVKWVDWDSSIIPVKIFIFDVTDNREKLNGSTGVSLRNGCQIEYEVEACSTTGVTSNGCTDIKRTSLTMPTGGFVIYGVAHQHSGGIGSTLYRKDGRVICTSVPTYGNGTEAGNEAGYIVGMSTCYPKPGSVKISDGENLILESKYSSAQRHTGVMGLFYILVADRTPRHSPF